MAAKSTDFVDKILKLIFHGDAIADLAEDDTTSPATSLYVSLHTATPMAGDQTTSEISYTGYAREAVSRDSGGWSIASGVVSNVASIYFGPMTGGTGGTATHFGIGTSLTGSGILLYSGPISPSLEIDTGDQPVLTSIQITEA